MKLVFAHDHKLRKIDGKYYTTGGLSDEITGRYMEFFDSLTIFCRAINKQKYDTQLFELKNPKVTIKPVSNGSLILSSQAKCMMEEEIKNSDALIVKLHSLVAEQAIKYARKYHKPYLVEVVGDPWDAYWNHGAVGKLIAPRMTLSTRKEVKRAPYVVYVTKEYLEKRYPCDGKWIDCSDVALPETDDIVLDRRLEHIKFHQGPFILGTLAQLDVPYKGQEYVIRAIKILKEQGITFRYRMAGMGDPSRLQKIAKECGVEDQIEFDGVLSHEQVFPWLDDIDLYIQPSTQEGLPRSVVEALSRACPAAGSITGGIPELIDNKHLFKKRDINGIAKILKDIEAEQLLELAKRNFKVSKEYDKKYLDNKRRKFYKEFYEYACMK